MRHHLILLFLILASLTPAAFANFEIRSKQIGDTIYVRASDIATYYGLQMSRSGKSVTLRNDEHHLALTLGRREATLNQVVVHFAFAPTTHGDSPMIAERDFTLLLDPILRGWGLPDMRVRRIVLDPGHGGKDDGTRGKRFKEKTLTLELSERTAQILREKGYEVMITRRDDRFIELTERCDMAQRYGADLFISVHFNAAGSSSAHGIETFIVTPQNTPSTPKNDVEDNAVTGNTFDALNHRFGYEIHRYVTGMTQAKDRGLKKMRFAVLREAPCPAVLVELGFLSNRAEEQRIASADYRETLAVALANGVISFDRTLWTNSQR